MPKEKYSFVDEIFEHSQRIGQHYGLYERDASSRPGCARSTGTTTSSAGTSRPTATTTSRPASSSWRSARRRGRSCPGIPGIDDVRGPLVPHQPLGLRLHRRRHDRRDDRPRRQAGRDHRHRRDGDPVRAAPGPATPGTCTCSSARRRRSTGAATSRPIRSGGRRSSRAGSASGGRTSRRMAAGVSPSRST